MIAMTDRYADVEIKWLGGNCPVQAEGRINGHPFYFRARWRYWAMHIAPSLDWPEDFCAWPDYGDQNIWSHREMWGDNVFAAGWMPEETAREMIARAARKYVESARGGEDR